MEDSSKMKTKPRHWNISCLGKYGQMRWRKLLLVKLIREEISLPFLATTSLPRVSLCESLLAKLPWIPDEYGESFLEPPLSLALLLLFSSFNPPFTIQLLKGKDCVMLLVSSHTPHFSRAWVKVRWVDRCRAERQGGRWGTRDSRWERPGTPSRSPKKLWVKSLGFQRRGRKLSPEKLSSTSYTNRLVKVLIAQMAPFETGEASMAISPRMRPILSEKGEARALLRPSLITSALCLSWFSDRPCWTYDHSSVWRLRTRSMIKE